MLDSAIVGAGPSGLAAAYEMSKHGADVTVVERLDQVGGLARTIVRDNCRYDIGPHRFFTKNAEVNQLFKDVVAHDLVRVPRLTRILYDNKLFNYPLTPLNALFGIGVANSMAVFGSYFASAVRQTVTTREPENFEQWIIDRFGSRLYSTFFKTYTEKVWGIPCDQIGADWAQQRIKGLSLTTAALNAIFKTNKGAAKTLVDEFLYPKLGAGQFYEKMASIISDWGGSLQMNRRIVKMRREDFKVRSITLEDSIGNQEEIEARNFMTSAPLTEILGLMDPKPPDAVLRAAVSLRYRDHIAVNLKIRNCRFPDNWLYIHSKNVKMARVANYRNFSSAMSDQPDISPVTVEYFTFEGDDVWSKSDEQLVALGRSDLNTTGLAQANDVVSGFVVRSKKAYPVIESGFENHLKLIKEWLDGFKNLLPIGRSGMFKYNNQDHALATGLVAARTFLGLGRFDPWLVNIDAEYHEAGQADSGQLGADNLHGVLIPRFNS